MTECACGSGLGTGGLGAQPFGSGYEIAICSAHAASQNAVDVFFVGIPKTYNAYAHTDALNPLNWTLTVQSPYGEVVRLVQAVTRVDSSTVRVFFDGPLAPEALYRITANTRVESDTDIPLDPYCTHADFYAFGISRKSVPQKSEVYERRRDLANPFLTRDAIQIPAVLGTFQLNDRHDFASETGDAYLRKRTLRRAVTGLGDFFHLSNYGFGEDLKSPITEDKLQRMQSRAEEQLLLEPDVVVAKVTAKHQQPGLVILKIQVKDHNGQTSSGELPLATSEA